MAVRVAAEFTDADVPSGRPERRAPRTRLRACAAYREGQARGQVEVVDLSPTGLRIESHLRLHPDSHMWVKLPGLEPLEIRVAWVDRHVAGCEFVHPLHPAVFDRIVAVCRRGQTA